MFRKLYPILLGSLLSCLTFAQDYIEPTPEFTGPEQRAEENSQINGDLNSNQQNSNNNNVNKTYNGAGSGSQMPVYSAVSPPLLSSGNDTCLMSRSGGLQLVGVGSSTGYYVQDEQCNRRKNSKTLKELGMSVAAVSLLCQDNNVWLAMFQAGTPCPVAVGGKLVVGRAAFLTMKQEPTVFIPNYVERQDFYDRMLNIGAQGENNEEGSDDSGLSISERFRSSTKSTNSR